MREQEEERETAARKAQGKLREKEERVDLCHRVWRSVEAKVRVLKE